MFSQNDIERRQKLRQQSQGLRRDFSLICALLFLMAQLLPAAAGSSGIWVEICGKSGVQLTLLDQDGEPSEPSQQQCNRCPLCLVRSDEMSSVLAAGGSLSHPKYFTKVTHLQVSADNSPDFKWARQACRGPPLASAKISMTSTPCLVDRNMVGPVSVNSWRAPWV